MATQQWSIRKIGTVGTLASQAEIDVWVQARERFYGGTSKEALP